MFVVRGIAVSLTFFILVYGVLSLLVASGWRAAELLRRATARSRANLLFWLRISPLLVSTAITLTLVIPAYVRLEPRSVDEDIALPLALALACLSLFATGVIRVITAHRNSARVVAGWLNGANVLDAGVNARTYRTKHEAPPLTLVGVCAPRVVVAEAAVAVLNGDELRVALQHELAHMRSRDNLKKLAFHCSPSPGMAGLESAWHEAAELAADDQAVSNAGEALDLAAALIKLTRTLPVRTAPAFTMALIDGAGSVSHRVQRLLAWRQERVGPDRDWIYLMAPASVGLMVAVASYGPALIRIHTVTEWLVR
jgi:Zn-dependent protease with chaperone function